MGQSSSDTSSSGSLLFERKKFQIYAVAVCLFGMAILLAFMLNLTEGHLNYALDDPYIHLALAEHIVQGHYGINGNENASPSSSIIYPILVAAALAVGLGQWAPLVLNLIGAAGTAWIISGILWDAFKNAESPKTPWLAYLCIPVLLVSINGYALGYTGMEHTLHVWASLAILRGLVVLTRTGAVPFFLIVACIATPLLRFEGLALSGCAVIAICVIGHWRTGLLTGAIIAACLGIYVITMTSLGLPPMPSSVMVKSGPTAAFVANRLDAIILEIQATFKASLLNRQGAILAGLCALSLIGAVMSDRSARIIASVAAIAGLAHLLAGQWDWFFRYEVYIIASLVAANLFVWTPVLSTQRSRTLAPVALMLAFAFIGGTYIFAIFYTPAAARNIYEQQFQMHRFSTEYFSGPVAIVDLGWVAYDNENYVLDLWGLGNEEARKLYRGQGRLPGAIRTLTQGADVSYAMLYEPAFPSGVPEEWCLIGQMSAPNVTSTYGSVEFFLIDHGQETDMRNAMSSFAPTLPKRVSFQTFDC